MYQITKEKYIENLKKRFPNDDFSVLNFINAKSPVTIKCNQCNQIFHYNRGTSLYSNKRKHFCQLCNSKSVTKMREICKKQNIIILKPGKKVTDFWKLHCNKCNTDFEKVPSTWLQQSCPNCGQAHNCFSKEIRQQMVDEKFGKGEFEVLSDGAATRRFIIRHKCGFIRNTQFLAFMRSKGCPRCNGNLSKGERKIIEYLDAHKITYISQKKMGDSKQSFDFFIPSLNMAIEYNGEQHYFPIETFGGEKRFLQQQDYDEKKKQYCIKNNINLQIICYLDFNNIDNILDNLFKKFNDQSQDVEKN